MSHRFISFRNVTVFAASLTLSLVGCVRFGGPPEEGVSALSNTQWQFFSTVGSAEGPAFVTANFGPVGELISFESFTITQAQDIFGDAILFDGQKHSTALGGLVQYQADMSGTETEDGSGFVFEGWFNVFVLGNIKAATGTISATATYDPSDPDTVQGTFTLSLQVMMVGQIPGIDDVNLPFIGHRVPK